MKYILIIVSLIRHWRKFVLESLFGKKVKCNICENGIKMTIHFYKIFSNAEFTFYFLEFLHFYIFAFPHLYTFYLSLHNPFNYKVMWALVEAFTALNLEINELKRAEEEEETQRAQVIQHNIFRYLPLVTARATSYTFFLLW